jgi:hypothetical protein
VTKIGPTTAIILTGSRWHPNPQLALTELARYVLNAPGWVIVRHGACPGEKSIDQAVSEWAQDCKELGVIEDPMPADWDNCGPECPPGLEHRVMKLPGDIWHPGKEPDYCPYAGPRRNGEMVRRTDPRAALVIAAPHGMSKGTRNCIRQARVQGIPVHTVHTAVTSNRQQEAMF